MTPTQTTSSSAPSRFLTWGHVTANLCTLVNSLLVTMQSQNTNPPYAFDLIQSRVDAFVR